MTGKIGVGAIVDVTVGLAIGMVVDAGAIVGVVHATSRTSVVRTRIIIAGFDMGPSSG